MRDAVCVVIGIALAACLLGALVALSGPGRIADALGDADLSVYALAFPASAATLLVWATVAGTLFETVDGDLGSLEFYRTYLSGVFAESVIPFGSVGGAGVIAYVLSLRSALPFERLLVAMSAAEFTNGTASLSVASAGLVYVLLAPNAGTPGTGTALDVGAISIAIVALGLVAAYLLVVRFDAVKPLVRTVAGVLRGTLGGFSDRVAAALDPAAIDRRLDGFSETLETVRDDRGALVRALVFGHVGWLLYATPLYVSLLAVGVRIEYLVVLFVLPIAGFASVIPTPGGLGAVDGAIAGMLILLTGVDPARIGAATLLFRVSTYGLTLLLTGSLAVHASVTADLALLDTLRGDRGTTDAERRAGGG